MGVLMGVLIGLMARLLCLLLCVPPLPPPPEALRPSLEDSSLTDCENESPPKLLERPSTLLLFLGAAREDEVELELPCWRVSSLSLIFFLKVCRIPPALDFFFLSASCCEEEEAEEEEVEEVVVARVVVAEDDPRTTSPLALPHLLLPWRGDRLSAMLTFFIIFSRDSLRAWVHRKTWPKDAVTG